MLFDFAHVPFSRRGRFLTLSTMEGAVWLRSVKGGDLKPSLGRLCRMSFFGPDGKGREVSWTLAPEWLVAEAAALADEVAGLIRQRGFGPASPLGMEHAELVALLPG